MLIRAEKVLRRGLGLRRYHAYCIGAAKTGTTSVAAMLEPRYLSAHEPEAVATNRLVIEHLSGVRSARSVAAALEARDRRLRLEMESAHPLAYVAPILKELFPEARFVVTVREPFSWLRSRVNFHGRTDPPEWREYRRYFWHRQHRGYAPQEASLEAHGLVSLDTYLEQYADHYRRVCEALASERMLIIRTSELSSAAGAIARFLEIPEGSLRSTHEKKAGPGEDLFATIDESFIRERIVRHCSSMIDRWFPETRMLYGMD